MSDSTKLNKRILDGHAKPDGRVLAQHVEFSEEEAGIIYIRVPIIEPKDDRGKVEVIITREFGFLNIGSHAAIWLWNGGSPILYDPGGDFDVTDKEGISVRGSGDFFVAEYANLERYIKFHRETEGSKVELHSFRVTREEEMQIAERIETEGRGYRQGMCALGVSNVLRGIGPFKNLGTYYLPGSLADALEVLKVK